MQLTPSPFPFNHPSRLAPINMLAPKLRRKIRKRGFSPQRMRVSQLPEIRIENNQRDERLAQMIRLVGLRRRDGRIGVEVLQLQNRVLELWSRGFDLLRRGLGVWLDFADDCDQRFGRADWSGGRWIRVRVADAPTAAEVSCTTPCTAAALVKLQFFVFLRAGFVFRAAAGAIWKLKILTAIMYPSDRVL